MGSVCTGASVVGASDVSGSVVGVSVGSLTGSVSSSLGNTWYRISTSESAGTHLSAE